METIKQINIKNRTYYFYNDIIDIENFDSSMLKLDKKSYKDIGVYNIGYITIKKIGDCKNINSVNPLYLRTTHASGNIEEINGEKYIVFDSIDKNRELSLHFHIMTITLRYVFEEDGKLYQQLFLDDTLYELSI